MLVLTDLMPTVAVNEASVNCYQHSFDRGRQSNCPEYEGRRYNVGCKKVFIGYC